jgi:hypothetical protein
MLSLTKKDGREKAEGFYVDFDALPFFLPATEREQGSQAPSKCNDIGGLQLGGVSNPRPIAPFCLPSSAFCLLQERSPKPPLHQRQLLLLTVSCCYCPTCSKGKIANLWQKLKREQNPWCSTWGLTILPCTGCCD